LSYKKALAIQAKITDPSPEFLHDLHHEATSGGADYDRQRRFAGGRARYAREALAAGGGEARRSKPTRCATPSRWR